MCKKPLNQLATCLVNSNHYYLISMTIYHLQIFLCLHACMCVYVCVCTLVCAWVCVLFHFVPFCPVYSWLCWGALWLIPGFSGTFHTPVSTPQTLQLQQVPHAQLHTALVWLWGWWLSLYIWIALVTLTNEARTCMVYLATVVPGSVHEPQKTTEKPFPMQ